MNNIEVLSPAGDLIRLKAAVDFGANAVYFAGKEFGMRAAPMNLELPEIREGVDYAHKHNAKAYLTLNTLPRNNELDRLPEFIEAVGDTGIDAFIVTDVGSIPFVLKYAPKAELHISVQTGIVNYNSANFYYNLGAKRVVLARELSLGEIAEIRAKTPKELELEAFVHGAICMSVSGRCLLSNYMTGRDANRGDCAQPCRWKYHLVEETRPGQFMQVVENDEGSYILNAQDMCLIEHIPELVQAGVSSLKIEGRAKTEYYTATVTNAYRRAVDGYINSGFDDSYIVSKEIVEEVNKISHRVYSTGFYFEDNKPNEVLDTGGYIRDYELVGIVENYDENSGLVTIKQRNKFYAGELDVLDKDKGSFIINVDTLYDENMNLLESAKYAAATVKFYSKTPLKAGSFLRVKK